MLKKAFAICWVGLFSVLTALPVNGQELATLALRNGQRPSGELIDLDASGFTLRINGRDRQFPANDVAAVEFGGAPPARAVARLDADRPYVVLRNGQIIEGRLVDIGGTRPLRLTFDTQGGQRELTSNDVAQIYLHRVDGPRRIAVPTETQTAIPAGAIVVQGNQPWTNTGITVARGERIAFSASGDIMIAANASSGVGGSPAATSPTVRYPVPKAPAGALIARVGRGVPFVIGPNTQPIVMPAGGQLVLGINDDHFEDNSGTYTVALTRLGR
jgi:hypothetical protein